MSGEWTGGAQNRHWRRTGHRGGPIPGDTARGQRLYAELADEPFWCETCGACHPLSEHQACRQPPSTDVARIGRGLINALNPQPREAP